MRDQRFTEIPYLLPKVEIRRSAGKSRRIADPQNVLKPTEGSAYPGANNFDPEQAQAIQGDLAESVRKFFADKQKCRPPGLQTISKQDGSIEVLADNPEVGVGLKVTIVLIGKTEETASPPGGGESLGVGPPSVDFSGAPAQTTQPVAPVLPPAPQPVSGVQVGPPVI